VSKQIKLLEDYLGFSLFDRRTAETVLTSAGRTYLAAVGPALQTIEDATLASQKQDDGRPLKIWCSPFVMRRWLMPRLQEFRTRMPGQNIVIDNATSKDRTPVDGDLGIQRGDGRWAGYRSRLLFPIRLVPVCSPSYLAGRPPPETFAAMAEHTVLENLARPDEWHTWSRAAGGSGLPGGVSLSLSSSDALFQAALDGMGIAIGRLGFIDRQLEEGSLVRASGIVADAMDGYYLLVPTGKPMARRALMFQRWLLRKLH
jgi:LysR family glycine cleavage system transcriptional activator